MQLENKENIYCQGDAAHGVIYIRKGGVKLTVVNGAGTFAHRRLICPGLSSYEEKFPQRFKTSPAFRDLR